MGADGGRTTGTRTSLERVPLPLALPPLSCSRTLTVAVPHLLADGVNVNVDVAGQGPDGALKAGSTEKSVLSEVVTWKSRAWPVSSALTGVASGAMPLAKPARL